MYVQLPMYFDFTGANEIRKTCIDRLHQICTTTKDFIYPHKKSSLKTNNGLINEKTYEKNVISISSKTGKNVCLKIKLPNLLRFNEELDFTLQSLRDYSITITKPVICNNLEICAKIDRSGCITDNKQVSCTTFDVKCKGFSIGVSTETQEDARDAMNIDILKKLKVCKKLSSANLYNSCNFVYNYLRTQKYFSIWKDVYSYLYDNNSHTNTNEDFCDNSTDINSNTSSCSTKQKKHYLYIKYFDTNATLQLRQEIAGDYTTAIRSQYNTCYNILPNAWYDITARMGMSLGMAQPFDKLKNENKYGTSLNKKDGMSFIEVTNSLVYKLTSFNLYAFHLLGLHDKNEIRTSFFGKGCYRVENVVGAGIRVPLYKQVAACESRDRPNFDIVVSMPISTDMADSINFSFDVNF